MLPSATSDVFTNLPTGFQKHEPLIQTCPKAFYSLVLHSWHLVPIQQQITEMLLKSDIFFRHLYAPQIQTIAIYTRKSIL